MKRIVVTSVAAGAAVALVLFAATVLVAGPDSVRAVGCPPGEQLAVPGAEFSQARCLDDLTTASNTFRTTNGGTREQPVLHSALTEFPDRPVPGVQIEGWFPDSCDRYEPEQTGFMPRCANGLRHNAQFVLRVPNDWDGVHLVVTGAPGLRDQYAQDPIISDWVLDRGWAYAAHDRGNTGLNFFRAGDDETDGSLTTWVPGRAIEQWAGLMQTTALAAEALLEQAYGRTPTLTYAAGLSNGGYQVRLALERYPELFDGGVDWEGTLFHPGTPNLFTYLPPVLRAYPAYRLGDADAYDRIVHEGRMPPGSEPLWDYHYTVYWGTTQSAYRPAFDPEYTNSAAQPRPVVLPGDPDAQYDYQTRPAFVGERLAAVEVTGQTHGRPLITLHGTLDALLPIDTASDLYAQRVRAAGHGDAFRYYVVEGGTHVDTLTDDQTDTMRPLLPCFVQALDALDAWVTGGAAPPPSGFVPFPAEQSPSERANRCDFPSPAARVAGASRADTAVQASRGAFGITQTVVLATAADFPDALAAGPLAASLDAPLLLVDHQVDALLERELARTGALAAIVVGGPAAVPLEVDEQLAGLGLAVRRVAGPDRFATAAAIARELGAPAGEAFVASGRTFADALAAGPVAAGSAAPILLVEPQAVPAATAAALTELGVQRTVVVGGTAAVGDAVAAELPAAQRIGGADRYATAAAIAEHALAQGIPVGAVGVATGQEFSDALAAGPVLAAGYGGAAAGGVLLLADDAPGALAPALDLLQQHGTQLEQVLLFGGPAALPASVEQAIAAGR